MVAYAGRQVTFTWGGETVPGVREKGITLNGEPIDVSSDEDNGWRALLANIAGERQVDISLSGVTKSNLLRLAWMTNALTAVAIITFPNGDVMQGTFHLSSYDEKTPFRDAITFDAKIASSGEITYTPA